MAAEAYPTRKGRTAMLSFIARWFNVTMEVHSSVVTIFRCLAGWASLMRGMAMILSWGSYSISYKP